MFKVSIITLFDSFKVCKYNQYYTLLSLRRFFFVFYFVKDFFLFFLFFGFKNLSLDLLKFFLMSFVLSSEILVFSSLSIFVTSSLDMFLYPYPTFAINFSSLSNRFNHLYKKNKKIKKIEQNLIELEFTKK